jgi:hypothetical protein
MAHRSDLPIPFLLGNLIFGCPGRFFNGISPSYGPGNPFNNNGGVLL